MTEQLLKRAKEALERSEAATGGTWIITLGSGFHLCTAIYSENEFGHMTFIADFLPDHTLDEAAEDHVPNMEFCQAARRDVPEFATALIESLQTLQRLKRLPKVMREQKSRWIYETGSADVKTRGGYIEAMDWAIQLVADAVREEAGDGGV